MNNDLDEKIRAFEKSRGLTPEKTDSAGSEKPPASQSRLAYEIIIAPLFFGGIGFLLDGQFATTPTLSLILFFIGFATGIYNAWRSLNGYKPGVGLKKDR